jgi:hypothetical protein
MPKAIDILDGVGEFTSNSSLSNILNIGKGLPGQVNHTYM